MNRMKWKVGCSADDVEFWQKICKDLTKALDQIIKNLPYDDVNMIFVQLINAQCSVLAPIGKFWLHIQLRLSVKLFKIKIKFWKYYWYSQQRSVWVTGRADGHVCHVCQRVGES